MKYSKSLTVAAGVALLLLAFTVGCDDTETAPPTAPTVLSTVPGNSTSNVSMNGSISATFSEPMDPATLTPATFTVTSGTPAALVPGTVSYENSRAVFRPTALLTSGTTYTATITTGAERVSGAGLAAAHVWTFQTGSDMAAGIPVELGAAGNYAILAKSAISTVPASVITGQVGLSPAAAVYATGFTLTMDATNVYSTSAQVTGSVYAADYATPTPANLTTAVGDMQLAFADAAGRAVDVTELGAGDIGGMTLRSGVFKWGTGLLIPTDITLTGSPTDVWIFQIAQGLTVSSAVNVTLSGGALASNVFWQVTGAVDIDTTAHLEGIVLGMTSITLRTGASINGRLLAQTAVVIDNSTVYAPSK